MAEIDVTQEWLRLQELYHEMSEEELESAAGEAYQLTDIAKQVLNAELAYRNLKVIVRLKPPEPEPEEPEGDADFDPANLDLAPAGTVDNLEQAEWVKKSLNDAGIPCYFGPDLVEDVHRLNFTQGSFQVMVLEHDQSRVLQALNHWTQKFPPSDEEPADFTVHCPKCNSIEIVLLGPESDSSEAREENEDGEGSDERHDLDVKPAPSDASFTWKCDECGYEWQDEPAESKG